MITPDDVAGAVLSPCTRFRYRLWRGRSLFVVLWLMLNPSTANAHVDDHTIRKVMGFSHRLAVLKGAASARVLVGNLYGLRATEPEHLNPPRSSFDGRPDPSWDPVGPFNDEHVEAMLAEASVVVFAWGAHRGPKIDDRIRVLEGLTAASGHVPLCLGLTAARRPCHPLTLSYATRFEEYPQ